MFMKYGDGKIVSVIEEQDLTEEQKKSAKDLSKLKNDKSSSEQKNQGDN